jgi:colanic acid/amylovoran biosynthesis glycosyltransferase
MFDNLTDEAKPIKLVYIIGTYPELTNTFIDREITTLRRLGNFQITILSIRYPHTLNSCSPEQRSLFQETLYLIPLRWSKFNFIAFIWANIYFIFTQPFIYFQTLIDLLVHSYGGIQGWMKAVVHFWQGVYAAERLRTKEFDHLHVHFMDRAVVVAMVVSRFLKKSYSFTAHAADIYTKPMLVRQKIDHARFMITVSHYNKQYLLDSYPGIDSSKIHILHPWVDISQFTPYTDRPVHDRLHILSVGRLVEKKGQTDLIEALYIINNRGIHAECRVVGEGPLHDELLERISLLRLQDQVQLLGGLPQGEVIELLREWADVFVLPCTIAKDGDRDGIPVSLAEAMAIELPVISTDIVGISELVQPGSGFLVPPHDPVALADALIKIASQTQSVSTRMGHKGREIVEQDFNLYKGTQQLAELFCQAVGKHFSRSGEV